MLLPPADARRSEPATSLLPEDSLVEVMEQTRAKALRVLHVIRATGISGAERQLIDLLSADNLWSGVHRELRLLAARDLDLVPVAALFRGDCSLSVSPMRRDASRALVSLLRREFQRVDVVHTHLVHADWHALAASRRRRAAWVTTKHNDDQFRRLMAFRAVEARVNRAADATIAISDSLARFTERQTGVRPHVIPYGYGGPVVDARPEARKTPPFSLLAVGRLTRQKGFDTAVRALPQVVEALPGTTLTIAGDGPERRALERLASELGVADSITFRGWVEEVRELMLAHDLLIHPARWEGFGLVLLEAMSARLPVVASNAGAIPDVLGKEARAALVRPDQPDALAMAITMVLRDPSWRLKLADVGVERLRNRFSMRGSAANLQRLYAEISR
jgi:glycosyltransferase involved in cell wall biosynthesis